MFRKVLNNLGIGIVIVVLFVFLSLANEYFLKLDNLMNILLQVSISTVIAVGMTFVILTGGIDLSVGSMTAVSSVIIAMTLHVEMPVGLRIALAMFVGIIVGTVLGAINGVLVVKGNVPAFIVTLGMMSAARGFALYITNGTTVHMLPREYQAITGGKIGILPIPVLYAAGVVLVTWAVLRWTKFGRYVYSIGGNKEAVRLSGINTKLVEFSVYAISGLACGIGAILLVGRLNAGQPIAGEGYELTAIAAAIIGGTSLSGGSGRIGGTVMGAVLMGMLNNGLNLLDVSQFIQKIIIGVVIVAAVLFDQFRKNRSARATVREFKKAAS